MQFLLTLAYFLKCMIENWENNPICYGDGKNFLS